MQSIRSLHRLIPVLLLLNVVQCNLVYTVKKHKYSLVYPTAILKPCDTCMRVHLVDIGALTLDMPAMNTFKITYFLIFVNCPAHMKHVGLDDAFIEALHEGFVVIILDSCWIFVDI